ncbi:MAG TPA: DUF433 domain-containing protein [Chthonomonadaceae bacterium]|nr:DUF433 domain-containing protein [Chthonomonadaceae bacterium]
MAQIKRETLGGEPYEYLPLEQYVVRVVGVCGGRPTFKYTRIEVAGALNRLAAGESIENIVAGYGGRVPREAVLEAIDIAARHFLDNLPELTPYHIAPYTPREPKR